MIEVDHAITHLRNGGMVVFTAEPNDKTQETLNWGMTLDAIYEVKMLPAGPFVGNTLAVNHPGMTPEMLLDATFKSISQMAQSVGGALVTMSIVELSKEN